jgi:cytidyltransferase-like protein
MEANTVIAIVSGGFDPIHPGHIEMMEMAARNIGPVLVLLNSDEWLRRKKGYALMDWDQRAYVVRAMRCVMAVHAVDDSDGTVCSGIKGEANIFKAQNIAFCNGGDRTSGNTPEEELCQAMGIQTYYGLGPKIASSSDLVARARPKVKRKWGTYTVLYEDSEFKVKLLDVQPGQATSIQRHQLRDETWVYPHGDVVHHVRRNWHQLFNPYGSNLKVIEVQTGEGFAEEDIERRT